MREIVVDRDLVGLFSHGVIDQCHPPMEQTDLIDGAPHQIHYCPPCIHGQIKMYAYPMPESLNRLEMYRASEQLHAQLDELTCLDHE